MSACLHNLNASREKPAPEIIKSIFSQIAVLTKSANSSHATIMLTPIIPLLNSLASLMWRLSSDGCIPEAPMTPIPPSLATAAAKGAREILTAIPPWIIGKLGCRSPILNFGKLSSDLVI